MAGSIDQPNDQSERFRTFKTGLAGGLAMASPGFNVAGAVMKVLNYFEAMKKNAPAEYNRIVSDINTGRNEEIHTNRAIAALK